MKLVPDETVQSNFRGLLIES